MPSDNERLLAGDVIHPRRNISRRRLTATFLGAIISLPGTAVASNDGGDSYFALTAGFSSGDFGAATTTDLYSLTPELGHVDDLNTVSVAVPFHHLRIDGGGSPSNDTGLGDAIVRGSRKVFQEGEYSLTGSVSLKLATGDENKGLGTGGTDLGVALSGDRDIGLYTYTILVGYTQVGEPSGVSYDNVVSYGVGINRRFVRSNVFASLQGQTSALPNTSDPLAIDAGFFRFLTLKDVVIAHALIGLSTGSPDLAVEVGLVRWF